MKRFRLVMMMLMLSVAGLTAGCAGVGKGVGGFNLISVEEEKQLGAKFSQEIEKQHAVLNDPQMQAYIDKLGRKLLTGAQEVAFDYTFKVVNDESVNAFAIPGGHLYVNTGLIKAAASETELAAVMAHEISHAVARHGTRQMTQQYGYALILQLLLGENPGMLTQIAASLFGTAGTMAYSRGMENQADSLGVETMAKAGYNPEGMANFFVKLDSMSKQKPGQLAQFFSSHPLTSDRLQKVREEIAKLPARSYPQPADPNEFRAVQARLK